MQIDLFGKKRYKVNLHTHTNLTDGRKSPGEVVQIYRAHGYDAIAITDHWLWGKGSEGEDFTVIPGAEYNIGGNFVCDNKQVPCRLLLSPDVRSLNFLLRKLGVDGGQ